MSARCPLPTLAENARIVPSGGLLRVASRAAKRPEPTGRSASGAKRFFLETNCKCKQLGYVTELRFDAGFVEGAILDYLTDEKIAFLARLKANARLQDLAAPHLRRPPGRPPKEGREVLVELGACQADSWRHAQRGDSGDRRSMRGWWGMAGRVGSSDATQAYHWTLNYGCCLRSGSQPKQFL